MRPLSASAAAPRPPPAAVRGRCARRRGLTLIEVTIALAVIAILFGAAIVGIGAVTGAQARKTAGELSGVIRSLYDTAALAGRTCRLAFDLPKADDDEGRVSYRAECAEGAVTTDADREKALQLERDDRDRRERDGDREDRRQPSTLEALMASEQTRVEKASRFSEYTSPEIEPRELPSSVRVEVWTRGLREKIDSGPAYLYFFPQGLTERAMVFVTQGNDTWTITLSPLTGKTQIVAEMLEVPSR